MDQLARYEEKTRFGRFGPKRSLQSATSALWPAGIAPRCGRLQVSTLCAQASCFGSIFAHFGSALSNTRSLGPQTPY